MPSLAELVWSRSRDVIDARHAAAVAASKVTRSLLFPNPTVDLAWGTIPVGRTNPPGLDDPLRNVPNYTAGLSELLEIAKRGPRQSAAAAEYQSVQSRAIAIYATRFFDLMQAIGQIAHSQLRASGMSDLVAASEGILELDHVRASKGDIAEIDMDRAEVDHRRLLAERDAALTELEDARASCAAVATVPVSLSIRGTPRAGFSNARLQRRSREPGRPSTKPSAPTSPPSTPPCTRRTPRHARPAAGHSRRHGALGLHLRHIPRVGQSGTELDPGRAASHARVRPRPSRSASRDGDAGARREHAKLVVAASRLAVEAGASVRDRIAGRAQDLDDAMAKARTAARARGGGAARRRRARGRAARAPGLPAAAARSHRPRRRRLRRHIEGARSHGSFPRPITNTEVSMK